MAPILTAVRFARFMDTGRTKPAIFACEDLSGTFAGEYVVKLRGGIETRESGLLRELLAAKLAEYFRIDSPQPALIRIEESLAELISGIEPSRTTCIRDSVGLNFGTKLASGYSIWPVDRYIPDALRQSAVDIFAFDAVIQNPDRRFDNPNLFVNGDSVLIFDHEMAFSFLLDIFPSATPWELRGQKYLEKHVFYSRLKSKSIDLEAFIQTLSALSDTLLESFMTDIPDEWNNDSVPKISQHIRSIREHASAFNEEIRRFLA